MAELTDGEAARLMGVFVKGYNALHRTDFAFDPLASARNASASSAQRDLSVDYICSSSAGKNLFVQHTEAWSDCSTERFWRRHVGIIRHGVEQVVATLSGGPFIVSLGIDQAPCSPDEAREVIEALTPGIRELADKPSARTVLDWRPTGVGGRFVSRVSLRRPKGIGRSTVLAAESTSRLDPVGSRAARALERKALRYGSSGRGIVLLIHYRVTNYDDEDLPAIREAIVEVPHVFDEVWVASEWWIDELRANRVWANH